MANFKYVAVDDKNKSVSGTLSANDRAGALAALGAKGLRPITVDVANTGSLGSKAGGLFQSNRVKSDDLVLFTRQLSAMVSAGVPLVRSLHSLQEHSESQGLRIALLEVINAIEGGATLADALKKHPNVFSDVYVNMVRAGETAGILDDILKRLAMQQEKSSSIRKKVKSAMSYPMVLVVITVIAFFGLMLFIIPQLGKIIKDLGGPDAELPALTQIMLGISAFMINFWYIIIPGIAGSVYALIRYIRTPNGKANFHKFILNVPAIKNIIMKVAIARFARTFSALLGAGVPVLEALDVTSRAVGNIVYEKALLDAEEAVKSGATLSSIIEQSPIFPAIVAQMLSVGEETGQTDTVLVKVADFYEEEVDAAIDGLSSIIEPVMIVGMGAMVGLIAASVMGPISSLAQNIKG